MLGKCYIIMSLAFITYIFPMCCVNIVSAARRSVCPVPDYYRVRDWSHNVSGVVLCRPTSQTISMPGMKCRADEFNIPDPTCLRSLIQ